MKLYKKHLFPTLHSFFSLMHFSGYKNMVFIQYKTAFLRLESIVG